MKKTALFGCIGVLSLTAFISAAAFSVEAVKSVWTSAPLQIDGVSSDWENAAFFHENKLNIDCAFRNDGSHLYIIFIFQDPKSMSTVEATGMKVFVNTENKKKKDWGLRFYKKMAKPEEVIASMEQKGQAVSDEEKAKIRSGSVYAMYDYDLLLKNKTKPQTESSAGVESPDFPKFRYARKGQASIYEFRIPLAKNENPPAGIGAEPGKTIKIGFEWGGMTEQMKAARLQRGGAQDVTGVSGDFTSQVGRVAGGSGGPPTHDFWIDVELAVTPGLAAGHI